MATTYTQAKATLDEIAARSETNRKKLDQGIALILAAHTDLTAMPSAYSGFSTDLDDLATANPNDDAIAAAVAELATMTTDFQALKTLAAS